MELKPGDYVQTDSGLKAQVVHVSRPSTFVDIQFAGGKELLPFQLSELTKVEIPPDPPNRKE